MTNQAALDENLRQMATLITRQAEASELERTLARHILALLARLQPRRRRMPRLVVAGLCLGLLAVTVPAEARSGGYGRAHGGYSRGSWSSGGWGRAAPSTPVCTPGSPEDVTDPKYRPLWRDGALIGLPGWKCTGIRELAEDPPVTPETGP